MAETCGGPPDLSYYPDVRELILPVRKCLPWLEALVPGLERSPWLEAPDLASTAAALWRARSTHSWAPRRGTLVARVALDLAPTGVLRGTLAREGAWTTFAGLL